MQRSGKPSYELLNIEKDRGLNRLPLPSEGDIFFDLEDGSGDAGLEYLWGYSYLKTLNFTLVFLDLTAGKKKFEKFVDFVIERKEIWEQDTLQPTNLELLKDSWAVTA